MYRYQEDCCQGKQEPRSAHSAALTPVSRRLTVPSPGCDVLRPGTHFSFSFGAGDSYLCLQQRSSPGSRTSVSSSDTALHNVLPRHTSPYFRLARRMGTADGGIFSRWWGAPPCPPIAGPLQEEPAGKCLLDPQPLLARSRPARAYTGTHPPRGRALERSRRHLLARPQRQGDLDNFLVHFNSVFIEMGWILNNRKLKSPTLPNLE